MQISLADVQIYHIKTYHNLIRSSLSVGHVRRTSPFPPSGFSHKAAWIQKSVNISARVKCAFLQLDMISSCFQCMEWAE